ncbi:uncharacterized protein LOC109838272 [Asparagus officinalis]|uniref:uncharacterized protein LOC109838272 n=1 Tax=Asparagus officinalis TaxID=4686 RepID=UPI00098E4936|nr:uncharacterized protein LOC109838272 [Asparagus officinalis]
MAPEKEAGFSTPGERSRLLHSSRFLQELVDELGIYMLSYDTPGYGESDPNPSTSVKSTAQDVEELADQLELGEKFFVTGFPMGGGFAWGCLKYIPHRLAGVAMVAPASYYWWHNFPSNVSTDALNQQFARGWNTQKWFPSSSVLAHSLDIASGPDKEILPKRPARDRFEAQVRQQGRYE